MALKKPGWFERRHIEIHASDASEAALAQARGRPLRRARRSGSCRTTMRDKYFTRDGEQGRVDGEAGAVRAGHLVVARQPRQPARDVAHLAGCDVIFCRNLFIYFTPAGVRRWRRGFARCMPSPGLPVRRRRRIAAAAGAGFELQELGGAYVYVKP